MNPAGYLPVALFVFGVIGMVWADVSLHERWKGLESFIKLLMIPLLLVQFRRSDRALYVFGAYLAACYVVFLLSSLFYLWPDTAFQTCRQSAWGFSTSSVSTPRLARRTAS